MKHQRTRRRQNQRPAFVRINEGRNVGELVRDSDPETGGVAIHAINRTQNATDRLTAWRSPNPHWVGWPRPWDS